MIITVTLNPSLDLTYDLADPTLGEVDVHRARTATIEASGKGVNVSRTLHMAGVATTAVLPVGGETGRHLADLLAAEGVDHVTVPGGGRPESTLAGASVLELAQVADDLAAKRGTALLVSMGSDGAIHADGAHVLHGGGPALVPVNTAGAGDAFLAGWLARTGTPPERMTRAVAWGRSACLSVDTVDRAPGTRGTDGITVTPLDPHPEKGAVHE
jgi:1-phosphofructokinase